MWRKAHVRGSDAIAAKAEFYCLLRGIITPVPPPSLAAVGGVMMPPPHLFSRGMLETRARGRRPPPAPGRNNGGAGSGTCPAPTTSQLTN